MTIINNIKIGARLILAFAVTIVLMAVIGFSGYQSIGTIQSYLTEFDEVRIPSLDYLVEADRDLQQLLVAERSMIYTDVNSEAFQQLVEAYDENLGQARTRFDKYAELAATTEEINLIAEYRTAHDEWAAISLQIVEGRKADTRDGRRLAIDLSLTDGASSFENMRDYLDQLQGITLAGVADGMAASEAAFMRAVVTLLSVLGGGLVFSLLIGLLITRSITSPLKLLGGIAQKISNGDFNIESTEMKGRDELSALSGDFDRMLESLKSKNVSVGYLADGDLSMAINKVSDADELGESLSRMSESLNEVLSSVKTAVQQVASGSSQIAQSSQTLSQGATEQASSLEEVSSSLAEIQGQSVQNSENAGQASELASQAESQAQKGNDQMSELTGAMLKISDSADDISKVVKVIDDIAFQINLLALNANVEAARAGKYGKGFAVVADEVRNLAVRSAQAVKETTTMVEETLKNVSLGNKAAEATSGQLGEIVIGSAKVSELLLEIASASKEQTGGMTQISNGLEQIDQVTQANTASAEEGASAAEELASQAQQLEATIRRFKLKNDQEAKQLGVAAIAAPVNGGGNGSPKPSSLIKLENEDFADF